MVECLYKCGSGAPSTQQYHVYPISGSVIDLRLEPGVVCDKCNAYFSKLEKHFLERHPGASVRLIHVRQTRKGKPPKFVSKAGAATRTNDTGTHALTFPVEAVETKTLDNGDILITGFFTPYPFDAVKVSRVLAKIALESLLRLPTQEGLDPYAERFDTIRKYARFGPAELRYLWFAWKRSSERQRLPCVVMVRDDGAKPIATLSRISLPGIAYLIPLPPLADPATIRKSLDGWNIVDKPGQIEQEPEIIETTLIRGKPPE